MRPLQLLLIGFLTLAWSVAALAGKRPPQPAFLDTPLAPARVEPITNLLEYLRTTMDTALADRDPVADRRMLSTHDDTSGTYVHNTNHPAYPFHGFTGISVRGTGANCGHNATLLSPRIVVTAGHCWQLMNTAAYHQDGQGRGAEWRFLDRDGRVHVAHAHSSRLLTNTVTGRATDTRMFVLSNALPASVEPAVWGSAEFAARAGGLAVMPRFVGAGDKSLWPLVPGNTNYHAWQRGTRGGDSGSGSFVAFRGQLVYVGSFGGDVLSEGVNWRETAEWLCTNFKDRPMIPAQVSLEGVE